MRLSQRKWNISVFTDAWSEKSVLETWQQPGTICLIAEKAGRTAGYLLAYTAAGEAEIARIGVAIKELQRQGAAKALLKELEKECAEQGIDRILLDVRVSNQAARALYEAAGFKEDGIRQRFYENPEEDAILMSRPAEKKRNNPGRGCPIEGTFPFLETVPQFRQKFPLGIILCSCYSVDVEKRRKHRWT